MKNEKLIYLTAFFLSLSLILLLEAGTLRLLAEDIKPVEKKEIAVELLLSASNNPAVENTKTGKNDEFKESKNEQEENDSKEKEAKNEEADKSSSAEKEKMELEKNDQFVNEEEKREEKEAVDEESQAEKIQQENDLKTEEAEETEEKIEEPKNENQKAEDKEKTANKKPAEQEETPSEKNIEEKQDTMPAWLKEEDNSKAAEAKAEIEEEKEDEFDLESYLAELENNDSAVQENKVNKNDGNKSEENLSGNEPEVEGESGENKAENRTENKTDTADEAAQNNEEKEVYDLREGGSGIKKPGIENYSEPAYPSNLRKRNIEGKVIISLRIDREGRAHDLKIDQSSGYETFDQAALKAVSSWEFKAAEKDGKKVGVIINLPIRFELN